MQALKENGEFTDEVVTQLAVMAECVYGAELIAYRMSRVLDQKGITGTVFHNRKQALTRARQALDNCLHNLEIAFDTQVLLLYFSRCDESEGKRDAIKKMLRRFKQNPGLDIESVIDYYRVK